MRFFKKKVISVLIIIILIFSNSITSIAAFWEEPESFEDTGGAVAVIKNESQSTSIFNLQSKSVLLGDASSGQVLFEKNCHEKLAPASVTKIMPLLLYMEAIDSGRIKLQDKVSCSEYAASMGGSQIWLEPGEQMTVDEMLKCICVVSANDCTVALGEHIYGSEEGLLKAMNDKAKALGMKDTYFSDATGLADENHYTSAYDIFLMSRELVNNHPLVHKYTTIWMDTVRNGEFGLSNTNKLVRFYKGCDGIKTGSTSKALFCVSESAKRNGLNLIAVIMAAPTSKDRFSEATKLLDHGFANYSAVKVGKKGDIYGVLKVQKGIKTNLDCVAGEDMSALVKKGSEGSVEKIISLETKIVAPVKKGQKVGEIVFKSKDKKLGKFDLVARESVDKATFIRIYAEMFKNWGTIGRQDLAKNIKFRI